MEKKIKASYAEKRKILLHGLYKFMNAQEWITAWALLLNADIDSTANECEIIVLQMEKEGLIEINRSVPIRGGAIIPHRPSLSECRITGKGIELIENESLDFFEEDEKIEVIQKIEQLKAFIKEELTKGRITTEISNEIVFNRLDEHFEDVKRAVHLSKKNFKEKLLATVLEVMMGQGIESIYLYITQLFSTGQVPLLLGA